MKKFILLFIIGLFATTFTFAQTVFDDCTAGSIFSQSILNPPSAYSSDENGSIQLDDFSGLTEDIGGMTFWGFMWDGSADCYVAGPQDFEIKFFQNNAGAVGTLVETFAVSITPTVTGLIYANNGASILRYDVSFPSAVSLTDGWFSVVKANPGGDPCLFYHLNTTNGNGHSAYILSGSPGTVNYTTNNRSFCLAGYTPPIPLSGWALGIGLLLISGFIVIRFRRRLA